MGKEKFLKHFNKKNKKKKEKTEKKKWENFDDVWI